MSTVQRTHETHPGDDGAHAESVATAHRRDETHSLAGGGNEVRSGPGHGTDETHDRTARSAAHSLSRGQSCDETHSSIVPADVLDPERVTAIYELRLFSRAYWDAQDSRKRIGQRFSAPVSDAEMLVGIRAAAQTAEDMLGKAMRKCFARAFPDVHVWVKDTPGVGDHLVARLLGEIGHPIIATPMTWEKNDTGLIMDSGTSPKRVLVANGEPYIRSVGQLWAYCGVGAPVRRRRGMTQEETLGLGKTSAKTLVHLVALGTIKFTGTPHEQRQRSSGDGSDTASRPTIMTTRRRSPYRDVYDHRRVVTADRGWTDGHSHADALRIVGKHFLADLYDICKPLEAPLQ